MLGGLGYLRSISSQMFVLGVPLTEVRVFFDKKRLPFATIVLKIAPIVHPLDTLCALEGHPNCIFSLFLCSFGFRIFWSEKVNNVLRHFTFPQFANGSTLCGDAESPDLLRVMFELVLTSYYVESEAPKSPVEAETSAKEQRGSKRIRT